MSVPILEAPKAAELPNARGCVLDIDAAIPPLRRLLDDVGDCVQVFVWNVEAGRREYAREALDLLWDRLDGLHELAERIDARAAKAASSLIERELMGAYDG